MTTPDEQKTMDSTIARVRDLRNQIAFLKNKYANDPVDNNTTPAAIDSLQNELNGIPNSGNW
jgi:hypothetical protein